MTNFILTLKDSQNIANFLNSFKIILNEQESLSSIRFCLQEDNLLVSIANQYSSLEYNIPIEYKEEKRVLFLETNTFLKILLSTKYDIDFNIDFNRHEIKLKYGKSKTSIRFKTGLEDYYRPIDSKGSQAIEVNSLDLLQYIKEASIFKAVKGKTIQPVYLNVLLNIVENKLDIVSSNNFCFYKNSILLENATPIKALITPRCLPSILNFLKLEELVSVKITDSFLFLETQNHKSCFEIAEGIFPDYNRVLASSFDYQIKINNSELIEAIRQALTLNEDLVNMKTTWKVDFTNKTLSVSNTDSKGQISESEIDFEVISGEQEEDLIKLNGAQVLDYLAIVKEEFIILNINKGKPIILTDEKNVNKLCLISPLKN